jgi:hypothetical protein
VRRIIIGAISGLFVLLAAPAPAAESQAEPYVFDQREFACPVGGAKFTQDVSYSTFSLVTFPDGSYPGDERIDAEIPVCPDNGLVILPDFAAMAAPGNNSMIYADYSAAELASLPALIVDPTYAALKPDGRHIQALWLATRLGRPAFTRFNLLQRATWAAVDPALRRRLVARLAEEGPGLIDAADLPDQSRRHYRFFIVNALRELGRFDEALALIDAIERQGPPVRAPVDPDNMYGPDEYAPQMRALIAEKDMERYPVRLMPPKWAASACGGEDMRPPYGPLSATSKAACKRRAAEQAREAAEIDAAMEEEEKLRRNPAALDRACAATPEAQRRGGLAMACRSVAYERDKAAGDAMAKDGPRLAAACEATPEDRRDGALRHGCEQYETVLAVALEGLLVDDDTAYGILCPEDGIVHPVDRAAVLDQACTRIRELRHNKDIDRMLADPAALDAKCASLSEDDEFTELASACLRRAGDIEQAERERIAGDDAAFARKCARFGRRLSEPANYDGYERESDALEYCWSLQDIRERPRRQAAMEAALDADFAGSIFAETSSLMIEARARAAAMIAKAKVEGTYPKRLPGDRPGDPNDP